MPALRNPGTLAELLECLEVLYCVQLRGWWVAAANWLQCLAYVLKDISHLPVSGCFIYWCLSGIVPCLSCLLYALTFASSSSVSKYIHRLPYEARFYQKSLMSLVGKPGDSTLPVGSLTWSLLNFPLAVFDSTRLGFSRPDFPKRSPRSPRSPGLTHLSLQLGIVAVWHRHQTRPRTARCDLGLGVGPRI